MNGPPALKIIGPLYIRGPNEGEHYRLDVPTQYRIHAHEVLLLAIMLFKATNNRDMRPLDYWEYIDRHGLRHYFVKVEGDPDEA